MRFDLITIFPEFFGGPLNHGILRRAQESGLVEVHAQDLRAFTKDRHRTVDDRPLGGGELPALLVIDAVTRLLPGALGNEASSQNESFSERLPTDASMRTSHKLQVTNHVLLDFPHYTRPAEYRGWAVPEVLIGGNHAEVEKWRRAAAIEKTRRNRPDLLGGE